MRLINLFEYWTESACCVQPTAVKLRSTGVNGGSPNEVSEKQKNLMIKELQSLDITLSKSPVTRYEVLFSDQRTFICYQTIYIIMWIMSR